MVNDISLKINSKIDVTISKQAFIDVVESLNTTVENIKINVKKTNIYVVKSANNVIISLDFKTKQNTDLSALFKILKSKIEMHSLLLMDQKPVNILLNYVGSFK